jgi:signal peptidase I
MLNPSHHQLISNLIDTELNAGDQIQFNVTSNSMQPIMQIGDSIVAEVVNASVIKPGDIIVIRRMEDFLTHRVILSTKEGWLTKGDNNAMMDPIVKTDRLIGLVKEVHKNDQRIILESTRLERVKGLLARLGELEVRASNYHRFLRFPFRICIKSVQKFAMQGLS